MNDNEFDHIGVIILAGGFGTRLQDLYLRVPKPMIEVCGIPFLEWIIKYFSAQGVGEFCVSAGYKGDVIQQYVNHRENNGLKLSISIEDSPQGTAGGFLLAAPKLSGKDFLLVTNGDSLLLADLRPIFRILGDGGLDAAIIGLEMDDCSRYGSLVCDEKGYLKKFQEKKIGSGLVNAGIYIFSNKMVGLFPKKRPLSFEYDVFPEFLNSGRKIKVFNIAAPFIDIGTPETVSKASDFIKRNESKRFFIREGNYDH